MLGTFSELKVPTKCIFIALIIVSVGGVYVRKFWRNYRKRLRFSKLRKDKQNSKMVQKIFTNDPSILINNDESTLIRKMSFKELIAFMKENEWNYKKVFHVYQQQALCQHQRLNCIVEFLKLDTSDVDLTGPFAGLPISIKDNMSIKGYESYAGCSIFLGKPKSLESCVLVQVLQKLGAIPFVKTVVPQTMMTILSSNPIDGICKNPQNVKFIPGGSSSGEGALVGARGSLLGFGSDIGGSVRIPAAFCSIIGLKPTVGRLSNKGTTDIGIHSLVLSTLGPLCHDVESCAFTIKAIVNSEYLSKLDPKVPFFPFNEQKYKQKKLKIGYFVHDDTYHVVPVMRRAVKETVKKLKEHGHELVEWKPYKTGRDWWKLYLRAISVDGGQKISALIENDQVDGAIANGILYTETDIFRALYNKLKYKLPDWIVDQDAKLFYQFSKETLDGVQCLALMHEIEAFREDIINDWSKNGLDAVICPAGGFTALPINSYFLYCPLLSYIFIWNLINFPAGTVPVTKVNRKDIEEMQTNPIYKSTQTMRNISLSQINTEGLSASVQCVGLPWNEELCLNLMKEVEIVSSK